MAVKFLVVPAGILVIFNYYTIPVPKKNNNKKKTNNKSGINYITETYI